MTTSQSIEFYTNRYPYEYKVSELTELQRKHMAHLLDHKTGCGYITAGHIARMSGEWKDTTLLDVFLPFIYDSTKDKKRKAKQLAKDVLKFDNYGTLELKKI